MSKAKKMIAFMCGMLDEEKNSHFIHEIEKECRKQGYLMVTFGFSETTHMNQDKNNCDLKLVEIAGRIDLCAIILQLEFVKNEFLIEAIKNLAKKKEIPVIHMERQIPGSICISANYKEGFAETVRHVIDVHGCRTINMLAGQNGDPFSEERIEAYKTVLSEHGIPFEQDRIAYADFWDRPARAAVRKFIGSGDVPQAFVCANDIMAIAACDELNRLGYRVPEDIIVTGFDGIRSGLFNMPSVSTAEPDYAREAVRVIDLIRQFENCPDAEISIDIDCVFRRRGSCGCNESQDVLQPEEITLLSSSYTDVNWAVRRINMLISQAAALESMAELSEVVVDTLWLKESDFQFAGVFSDILSPETGIPAAHEFTTFFRGENCKHTGIGVSYDEIDFIPGFDQLIRENDFNVLIVRLLHTGDKTFGYVVEGIKNISNRDIRRCEEFTMFLSTAINSVLTNRSLAGIHREMEKISASDYLTGIPNRRGFYRELHKIVGMPSNKGRWLTVFSVDLDNLKVINDFYGHAQGDFTLKNLAEAIQIFSAENGICARLGGDEFACVLITDSPSELTADTMRSRLEQILLMREEVRSKSYEIAASIGRARAIIDDSLDLDRLLGEADEAMYKEKKQRKSVSGGRAV